MIQPVILSGGSGTRLWPLSREQYPKQLLPLTSSQTMLQDTISRLGQSTSMENAPHGGLRANFRLPIIVCNEQHRFLVAEQLRQIDVLPAKILLEPVGRNTAPALTLAALQCNGNEQDDVMLVMPADHVIQNIEAFHQAVELGNKLAEKTALVTFGIVPGSPETGYGYIRKGEVIDSSDLAEFANKPYTLAAFVEKPDADKAQKYVDSGDYLWNSGMFMMKASTWLQEIEKHQPLILEACRRAYQQGKQDLDFFRVDNRAFTECPADSIDYAVMEHSATESLAKIKAGEPYGVVVPLDAGWSDVGAWSSLWEVADQDDDGNVMKGDVITHDTHNSFIHAQNRLVASVGLDDIIIVETSDAVLVAKKSQAQDVKQIVNALKLRDRSERLVHRQVYRPWGSYEGVVAGERFQVKRIIVTPGASLSLQMHHHRAEHWIVVRGTAKVTRGDNTYLLSENESTYIPLGTVHRLENPGTLPLEIIEVQSGSYLGEDDIVRYEDDYGRGESDTTS